MANPNRNNQNSSVQAQSPRHTEDVADAIHRVALYARVSTVRDQNPEMQLRELREYADRRGWTVVSEYIDHGVSGSKDSRPQLNRLMAAAHRREFDAVAVWKIDRFGRSLKHLVTTLADLSAYNAAFVSLRDNIDLSMPSGRLMFHMISALAEYERELIRERVVAGISNAQAKGKHCGRPRTAIDAPAVRRLRSEGRSWSEVCRELGISKGSAQRAAMSVSQAVMQ